MIQQFLIKDTDDNDLPLQTLALKFIVYARWEKLKERHGVYNVPVPIVTLAAASNNNMALDGTGPYLLPMTLWKMV